MPGSIAASTLVDLFGERAALAVTVATGTVWLALIAANILEAPLSALSAQNLWTVISGTRFGLVACLRLGFAFALAVLLAVPIFPGRGALQLTAAAGLAGLLSLVGHAGATPGVMGWLHLTSDVLHVLAAATGVSLLVAQSAVAFTIVKYVGAVYLVYLGVRLLLQRSRDTPAVSVAAQGTGRAGARHEPAPAE